VKKLGWSPDLVHCHGWMSALAPIYVKKVYYENPLFAGAKVITSIYDDDFTEIMNPNMQAKMKREGIAMKDLKHFKKPDFVSIMKSAIDLSEGIILASDTINEELLAYINQTGKPVLPPQPIDTFIDAYNAFYEKILHG
jgi:starch synthase